MHAPLSPELSEWLLYDGSFMQRLKARGIYDARVHIVKEGWSSVLQEERALLNIPLRQLAWVREVLIRSGETIWMFARTVIPQATLTGKENSFKQLKQRSLGSLLFRYKDLVRGEFDIFPLRLSLPYCVLPDEVRWARRSCFYFQNKSLLLTEVFFTSVSHL